MWFIYDTLKLGQVHVYIATLSCTFGLLSREYHYLIHSWLFLIGHTSVNAVFPGIVENASWDARMYVRVVSVILCGLLLLCSRAELCLVYVGSVLVVGNESFVLYILRRVESLCFW